MKLDDFSNDPSNHVSVLQSNMQIYQLLVQELLKSKPEEKIIKRLMRSLGLSYTEKHIDRLSSVLAFNPLNHKDDTRDL